MPQTPEERRAYMREYQRAWRARNPERAKAAQRKSVELNRDKINERKRSRRALNVERAREKDRAQRAKDPGRNQHGRWIKQDRVAMWEGQSGNCYLCGEPMDPVRVRIDHDHTCCPANSSCRTCRRGLAHHRCNIAIGMADDDPERLRHMADALEAAQAAVEHRKTTIAEQLPLSGM
jgi:hypothetical protein